MAILDQAKETFNQFLSREAKIFDAEIAREYPSSREPKEIYSILHDHYRRGGKRLRPILCKVCCEAVGGDGAKSIPVGTAVEMFHNFTLLHDDIEDNSDLRRCEPCVYKTFGLPLALNAGDMALIEAYSKAHHFDFPEPKKSEIIDALDTGFKHVLRGQAIELNWYSQKRFDITLPEYFKMIEGKTGALMAAAALSGAIVGNATSEQKKALFDFGMAIGVGFQIQDDALNLIADEKKYGKEIGGDISEGKRTLMTIHAIEHASPQDRARLIQILGENTKDQKKVLEAIAICQKYDSIAFASDHAKKVIADAKKAISAFPKNEATRRLNALADFFINREM